MSVPAPKLLVVLARSHRAVTAAAERSIGGLGLCLSDFMVLEALLHKGPLTITAIQEKVLLASGSTTAAVDRLERKGLMERKTTERDRRERIVVLTPKGTRLAKSTYERHAADLEDLMSVLNETEKERLYATLKKLGRHIAKEQKDDSSSKK